MYDTYQNEKSLTFSNYLGKTFLVLGLGLTISAIFAFIASYFLRRIIYTNTSLAIGLTVGSAIGELVIAIFFTSKLHTMKKETAWVCYFAYAILTGFSLSSIFLTYSLGSITLSFVSVAVMFVCMAVIGMTTKIDLSKYSSLAAVGLISIFVITLLNIIFFKSAFINVVITYIGIVIFLVLIAMDIQRLRNFYNSFFTDSEMAQKGMLMGAFQLYLDFINLFIRVLRILGRRRD